MTDTDVMEFFPYNEPEDKNQIELRLKDFVRIANEVMEENNLGNDFFQEPGRFTTSFLATAGKRSMEFVERPQHLIKLDMLDNGDIVAFGNGAAFKIKGKYTLSFIEQSIAHGFGIVLYKVLKFVKRFGGTTLYRHTFLCSGDKVLVTAYVS